MTLPALLLEALRLPGSIIMGGGGGHAPGEIGFVSVGIQQPRVHMKFAWFVIEDSGPLAMYFRHDPQTIHASSAALPGIIAPCERYPGTWSRISFPCADDAATELLRAAHFQGLAKLTKKGRAMVGIESTPNTFLDFHRAADVLASNHGHTHLDYSDGMPPEVLVNGQCFATFEYGALRVRQGHAYLFIEHAADTAAGWVETLETGFIAYQEQMVGHYAQQLASSPADPAVLTLLRGIETSSAQRLLAKHTHDDPAADPDN